MKVSKNANQNYLAKIVKIKKIDEIKGADNIAVTNIEGNDIIVSKQQTKVGDLVVYFPVECQIQDWYLKSNNLYSDKSLNEDTTKGGFFGKKGRVRCVKLMNVISSGFVANVESLNSNEKFKEGDVFDTIDDKLIVKKYVVQSKERIRNIPNHKVRTKGTKFDLVIPNQFRFHINTPKLPSMVNVFDLDTEINISRKVHGTSGISSYVLCNKKVSFSEKFIASFNNYIVNPVLRVFGCKRFKLVPIDAEYKYLYASRTVIKTENDNSGYYNSDIWEKADKIIKPALIKGMTIYYEIIGYLENGKFIQKDYNYGMTKPDDSDNFTYGDNFFINVYRITMTNPDGNVIEFSPYEVETYCKENSLTQVTQFYTGTVKDFLESNIKSPLDSKTTKVNALDKKYVERIGKNKEELLEAFETKLSDVYLNKKAVDCNNNPDEGIVIRVKNGLKLLVCKFKSPNFLLKETKEIDNGTEDIEA